MHGRSADKTAMERVAKAYELGDGDPSKRLMLFPRGVFKHPEYGRMEFDDEFFGEIQKHFDSKVLGNTLPFIDVDHNHGAAAGWIHGLTAEPDGLYASHVEWTPLGQELVKSGQYKYFSPWWGQYKDPGNGKVYDRVLRGGGLTNVPFLKVLPAVELFEPGQRVKRQRALDRSRDFKLHELVPYELHLPKGALTLEQIIRRERTRRLTEIIRAANRAG